MSGNGMLVDSGDLIRREGGSGLLKVHKIIRYDLRDLLIDQRAIGDCRRQIPAHAVPGAPPAVGTT